MLKKGYQWLMHFSDHPSAIWVLSAVSFAESSFFPLPPDPLFVTMGLQHQSRLWFYAVITTLASVLGGYLGYCIGFYFFEYWGTAILGTYGLEGHFLKFQTDFQKYGFWLICLKGLTPIPYKVVTIASGAANVNLLTFTIASLIARGFRFFYVSILLWKFGPQVKQLLEQHLKITTLVILAILVVGFFMIKWIYAP